MKNSKKMQSLKRILYCAENDLLSYQPTYRNRFMEYCSIGCLFTDDLINNLVRRKIDQSAQVLFDKYPGLVAATGLSPNEAQDIQQFHDDLRYLDNSKNIFIKKVKSWIAAKGII